MFIHLLKDISALSTVWQYVNLAAMNIGVQVPLQITTFVSLG